MIDTLPAPSSRSVLLVLQGVREASTVRASRLDYPIATVSPCEDESADFGQPDPEDEAWTEAKNQRRCDLINRKYAGGLTAVETRELARLQTQMLRHRDRVAPLPLGDARRLYTELLADVNASRSPTDP